MPVAIPFVAAAAAAAADVAVVGVEAVTLTGVLTAASLGFAAGSIIGNLLFPTHTSTSSVGPRVGDLTFQTSTYGVSIPITYGTDRLSGNVIWALPIKEVSTTTTQGGGGKGPHGGGSASTTTFTYFGTFAVGLCEGVKQSIIRIWANNKLVYDTRTGADVIKTEGLHFTFYAGTETQLPDPLIEADKGVGNVPAHRGLCYVVFHDAPLKDFNNTLPDVSFEVTDSATPNFRHVALTPGSVLSAGSPTGGWLELQVDPDRQVGYATWGSGNDFGIARFGLDDLIVNKEALISDMVTVPPGPFDLVEGLLVGPDHALYVVESHFHTILIDRYVVRIDPATFFETGRVLVNDDTIFDVGTQLKLGFQVTSLDDSTVHNFIIVTSERFGGYNYNIVDCDRMTATFTGPSFVGPGTAGASDPIMVQGASFPGYTDVWVAYDQFFPTQFNCQLQRIRVYSDGSSDSQFVYEFTGTEFDPAATGTFGLDFTGFDVSTHLLLGTISIYLPGSTPLYQFAVTTEGHVIWSKLDFPGPYAATTGAFSYVNGTIINGSPDDASEAVILNTADGTYVNCGVGSLLNGNELFWDSATSSYIRRIFTSIDRVWIGHQSGATTTLGAICADMSERAGNASYDVTSINSVVVTGFTTSRVDSAANILNAILPGFQVDVVESDYRVKFKARGSSTVTTVTEDNLVFLESNEAPEPYKETWQQSIELPTYLNITYQDPALDYQPNTQHDQRVKLPNNPTVFSGQISDIQVPAVIDATKARQLAETLLYATWLNRHTFQLRMPPRYFWLDTADAVQFTLDSGYTARVRLGKTDFGLDYSSDTLLIGESDGQYTSSLTVDVTNPFPLTIPTTGPSFLILLDTPLLRDGDEVVASSIRGYWGSSTFFTGTYPGAVLYASSDGTAWAQLDAVSAATPFGTVEVPPPDPTLMWATERGTSLTVVMTVGESHLVSVTDVALFNGANRAALIKSNGEVEVLQYKTVTALGSGRYTLSNLARGRRGTDTMASGHASGELFVLLGVGTVHGLTGSISNRNVSLWWEASTIGAPFDASLKEAFTFHARDKLPYAPVEVTAVLSGSDIDLAWVRRTRVDGGLRDGTGTVPLHETTEAYEVEIYSAPAGTLLRTLTGITSPATVYFASQISSDFGGTPASLTLRVYQLSNAVGRGFSREDTVVVG